jgi:hypothetical protein
LPSRLIVTLGDPVRHQTRGIHRARVAHSRPGRASACLQDPYSTLPAYSS